MSREEGTGRIMCSLKEIDTFKGNTNDEPEEKFLQYIKNYNDCSLFSSEFDRPVSQENRHIHFLLKLIEKERVATKNLIEAFEAIAMTPSQRIARDGAIVAYNEKKSK